MHIYNFESMWPNLLDGMRKRKKLFLSDPNLHDG
jgi:hypothetical protein